MKPFVRITKIFKFETAHALYGYDGLCKNIHGHSYKLDVTLKGSPIEEATHVKKGMVMDFGDIKELVNNLIVFPFDHAIVLNVKSPHAALADTMEGEGHKIVRVDYQPTCEMMVLDFAEKIQLALPKNYSTASS